jgi:hypothetical protein
MHDYARLVRDILFDQYRLHLQRLALCLCTFKLDTD